MATPTQLPIRGRNGRLAEPLHMPDDSVVLAYIAGLMDGEGCITIKRQGRAVQITVTNTDKPVMEWLVQQMGGRLHMDVYKTLAGDREMWRWQIAAWANCHVFLSALLPYLRIKRAKALEAIAVIEEVAA